MDLLLEAPRELFMEAWFPEPDPLKALADRLPAPLALVLAPADRLPEAAEDPKLLLPAPALALPGRVDEGVLPMLLLTWPDCLPELHALEPLPAPPRLTLPVLILPVLILVL